MTEPLSVETIVEAGLCMVCGLCRSVAPECICIDMNSHVAEDPRVDHPLAEAELELINQLGPGLSVEGRAPLRESPKARWDTVWGPALAMVKGHATDPDVRFRGSAGGALSALGIHLLQSGEVDFILHVAAARARPMRSEARVSTTPADLLSRARSRDAPAAALGDLI